MSHTAVAACADSLKTTFANDSSAQLQWLGVQAGTEVLQALPSCGQFEVRIGHRLLLEACLRQAEVPQELRQSLLALLSTAAACSPLSATARPRLWPSIRYCTPVGGVAALLWLVLLHSCM